MGTIHTQLRIQKNNYNLNIIDIDVTEVDGHDFEGRPFNTFRKNGFLLVIRIKIELK